MSIYIKGMEMPEFFDRLFVGRSFDGGIYIRNEREDEKSDSVTWYPVIEIPPHGRLIDADELKRYRLNDHYRHCLVYDAEEIENAPTVIPADKEDRQ